MVFDSLAVRLYQTRLGNYMDSIGLHGHLQSLRWRVFFLENGMFMAASHTYQGIPLYDEEVEVMLELFSSIKDGDVFYDIGANLGTYCGTVSQMSDVEEPVRELDRPSHQSWQSR